MANFDIGKFSKLYKKDGKTIFKSNLEEIGSVGIIGVLDPSFAGRRAGEFGEYLQLRDKESNLYFLSIAKGCPKGANAFDIKRFKALEDYEKMKEGDIIYKAFGIVVEEEED